MEHHRDRDVGDLVRGGVIVVEELAGQLRGHAEDGVAQQIRVEIADPPAGDALPHVAAGVYCETCHGNMAVTGFTVAANPQVMNMGWCLECHRARTAEDPEKRTKLLDCGTCHY